MQRALPGFANPESPARACRPVRQAAGLLRVTLWEALDRLAALGATGNATAESVLAGLDTLEATNKPDM